MSARDPAAARFAVIQLVRFVGVALVIAGLLVHAGRLPGLAGLPAELGYALIAIGLVEVFALPTALARRWRSGPRA